MNDLEELQLDLESRGTSLLVLETSVRFLNNVLAIVGNILTLIIVVRTPRLRTVPNKFVVSLALSDLMMAVPSTILTAAILIESNWPFDQATCQFQGYYGITLAFASSVSLTLMSLNRYYRIVKPNEYRRMFTARTTSLMIKAAWMIASLIQLPYIVVGHRYIFHPGKIYCNQDGKKLFSTILVCIFGGIPMSVIFFCCLKVFRSVRSHKIQRFRDVAWKSVNVEDIKVSRMLLVIVLAYVICFSPVIIIESVDFIIGGSFLPRPVYFFYTFNFSATLSYAVNPVVYGAMNRAFRQEYKRLLCLNRFCENYPSGADQAGLSLSNARIVVLPFKTKLPQTVTEIVRMEFRSRKTSLSSKS